MTQVLVLDGRQRSALAVTRSLGKRGLTVHVADCAPSTLAGASRHASSELVYPDPQARPHEFCAWVVATAQRVKPAAILPLTDLTVMLLAPLREQFAHSRLLCAPDAAYRAVSDKAGLIELARTAGVLVPGTQVAASRSELEQRLAQSRYPLVLKPARSRIEVGGRVLPTGVGIARSLAEALAYVRRQEWLDAAPCLIQEFIHGHGAGVFALYSRQGPVAWFSHRRIREKPPGGGVSVLSESAPVDPVLRQAAARILDAVAWEGPAMVEFRVTPRGEPYLMEINGRLWGSLQLAIDSGVDFPWLMYRSAMGDCPAVADAYVSGRRLRWLLGDFDRLLIVLRQRDAGVVARLEALRQFVGSFFDLSARQEVFRWSDPRPGVRELHSWLRALA